MKHQPMEGTSAETTSRPEVRRTARRRRPLLLLIAATLVGAVVGAVGMSYVRTTDGVLSALAHLLGAASEVEPEEAGRERDAVPGRDDTKLVSLTDNQIAHLNIEVAVAQSGRLLRHLTLPGAIVLNTDRLVHTVPRIPGVVREVRKHLGDAVRVGDVLAVIDSRELADAKAAYLAAGARVTVAEETFVREKDLWEKKISPAQDYLTAKQTLVEARIELRATRHKLAALGVVEAALHQLASQPDASLTRYEIIAPSAG